MGTVRKKSILTGIRGGVGPMVFSDMRNTQVVKQTPQPPKKNSGTSDQLEQRALFDCAKRFLRLIGYDVVRIGYQLPKKTGMSEANAAMSHLMLEAMSGKYPDFKIDIPKVKLSKPINEIDACWNGSCVAAEGLTIELKWELNPYPEKATRMDDRPVIVLFDETLGRCIFGEMHLREVFYRSSLQWNYKGYSRLAGHHIHCWIFFVSDDGRRVSETEYLGMVTMKE